jgi:hypothetical protein
MAAVRLRICGPGAGTSRRRELRRMLQLRAQHCVRLSFRRRGVEPQWRSPRIRASVHPAATLRTPTTSRNSATYGWRSSGSGCPNQAASSSAAPAMSATARRSTQDPEWAEWKSGSLSSANLAEAGRLLLLGWPSASARQAFTDWAASSPIPRGRNDGFGAGLKSSRIQSGRTSGTRRALFFKAGANFGPRGF